MSAKIPINKEKPLENSDSQNEKMLTGYSLFFKHCSSVGASCCSPALDRIVVGEQQLAPTGAEHLKNKLSLPRNESIQKSSILYLRL
jgi:hypothetical protein